MNDVSCIVVSLLVFHVPCVTLSPKILYFDALKPAYAPCTEDAKSEELARPKSFLRRPPRAWRRRSARACYALSAA